LWLQGIRQRADATPAGVDASASLQDESYIGIVRYARRHCRQWGQWLVGQLRLALLRTRRWISATYRRFYAKRFKDARRARRTMRMIDSSPHRVTLWLSSRQTPA